MKMTHIIKLEDFGENPKIEQIIASSSIFKGDYKRLKVTFNYKTCEYSFSVYFNRGNGDISMNYSTLEQAIKNYNEIE